MFDVRGNETPVYPFEYDHLLLYTDAELHDETGSKENDVEADLYNHETYKYH